MIMRVIISITLPMLLTSCLQDNPLGSDADAATKTSKSQRLADPVVVELYQSQGCSSCPPANEALNAEADRSDVIALNFSVTYWDRLGWKDIFGDPKYTQRQYDYAAALKKDNVYTPQVIINGSRAIVGNAPGEISRAIAAAARNSAGPTISEASGKVTVGTGSGKADVWLARYDARIQNVAIKAGENSGRTLPHKNIVRQLVNLGAWHGQAATYALPASPNPNYRSVILVQRPAMGVIISARKL
jgi:hypothetical protein